MLVSFPANQTRFFVTVLTSVWILFTLTERSECYILFLNQFLIVTDAFAVFVVFAKQDAWLIMVGFSVSVNKGNQHTLIVKGTALQYVCERISLQSSLFTDMMHVRYI